MTSSDFAIKIGCFTLLCLAISVVGFLGILSIPTGASTFADPGQPAAPACTPQDADAPGLRLIAYGCNRPVVFFIPGLGAQASDRQHVTIEAMFAGLIDEGYGLVVADVGFNTWGNPESIEALHQRVQQFNGGLPPRLIGISMSGTTILNYGKKYPVHAAAGLIPVTKWTREVMIRSGHQPPLPTSVPYPYTIWHGTEDDIVGYPQIDGAEVRRIDGGHVTELNWPAAEIAEVLR